MQSAASLLEAVDWDHHLLGPREAWPAPLKLVVNSLLGSPESMYLVWGADRTFMFNDAYRPILGPRLETAQGARFEALWADAWPTVEAMYLAAEAGRASRVVDLYIPMARYGEPEDTWWTFSYTPVRDDDGAVLGVLCVTNETSDKVRAEAARAEAVAQQELLNHELSHRVKNIMSMVQAIAAQSLKTVEDKGAVRAFEDRLIALGHAHDVLLQHQWRPASVRSVIGPMLALHDGRGQFRIEGPDVLLAADASLSLSLLLHELATNAAKHGALSVEGGRVSLNWAIEGDRFVLEWREAGGPPVTPPVRKGFGSRLIAAGLRAAREAELVYAPEGFPARFTAPLERMTRD
ncbi:sensor histidine kinase [Caulobacter endophyticus]|uniref:sensor histidine kinase n=1 Tax=Caulobacter endophyticus TaxID=2172652 RepID=UPI00240F8154|nr:PAS domain-containing sensor histidine kinase [Caulobacter endophyticus]MDG2528448.1 HWE histidine kinase domain-containing protein [Caulobacter endophyticus]